MDVWERDWGMIKQYVDLLTGCKIKLSCARERLTIDVHCFYNKKTEHPLQDTLHGPSVIIESEKISHIKGLLVVSERLYPHIKHKLLPE